MEYGLKGWSNFAIFMGILLDLGVKLRKIAFFRVFWDKNERNELNFEGLLRGTL